MRSKLIFKIRKEKDNHEKIIAMIMTGAIALSLTACSNSSGSAPSPSSNGTSSGNTAGAATDKAASDIDTSEYGNLDPVELVLADSAAKAPPAPPLMSW